MVDINRLYKCKDQNPKKKGEYMLIASKKSVIGNWHTLYTFNADWNGHKWNIPDNYKPVEWKFLRPEDIEKYGPMEINKEGEDNYDKVREYRSVGI